MIQKTLKRFKLSLGVTALLFFLTPGYSLASNRCESLFETSVQHTADMRNDDSNSDRSEQFAPLIYNLNLDQFRIWLRRVVIGSDNLKDFKYKLSKITLGKGLLTTWHLERKITYLTDYQNARFVRSSHSVLEELVQGLSDFEKSQVFKAEYDGATSEVAKLLKKYLGSEKLETIQQWKMNHLLEEEISMLLWVRLIATEIVGTESLLENVLNQLSQDMLKRYLDPYSGKLLQTLDSMHQQNQDRMTYSITQFLRRSLTKARATSAIPGQPTQAIKDMKIINFFIEGSLESSQTASVAYVYHRNTIFNWFKNKERNYWILQNILLYIKVNSEGSIALREIAEYIESHFNP